jgi:two-component system, cell cycle sensor histidine kinase and response regulator CckA
MLQRLLGEGIALRFHPAAQGRVEADPGQMEQIFINLAVNAREAMPDGGKLIIETSDEEISTDAAIRQPGMAAGAYVRLLVRDSGRGMDGATLERIFDPFFTTKNAATGAGLGLAVIFGIIRQHRGLVQAESIPGQGTSFSIYLPRAVAGDQSAAVTEMLPLPPARRTILLVEHEPEVRNVIRRMLVKAGYLVIDAENPGVAEKLFAEKKDEIALLITDMVMPGSSGRDLYGRLAGQAAGLKVLFMSGQLENPLVREEIMGGALPFIAKPFSPEGLDAKIKEILR